MNEQFLNSFMLMHCIQNVTQDFALDREFNTNTVPEVKFHGVPLSALVADLHHGGVVVVEQLPVPGEEVLEPPDIVPGDAAQVQRHVLLLARDLQRRQREVAVAAPPHRVPGTISTIIITNITS